MKKNVFLNVHVKRTTRDVERAVDEEDDFYPSDDGVDYAGGGLTRPMKAKGPVQGEPYL